MESFDTIEYRGFNINLHYDEYRENPREAFDPLGKIACVASRDYNLGDEQHTDQRCLLFDTLETVGYSTDKMIEDFDCLESDSEFIDRYWPKLESLAVVLPVSFQDYGSRGCYMMVCHSFDEDTTGIIYISKTAARKEYGRLTKTNLQKVIRYMTGEVKEYSSWLAGEVYGYIVEPTDRNKGIDCDDSCWGFYGETDYMISEAKSQIDYAIKRYRTETVAAVKAEKLRKLEMNHFFNNAWAC